MAVRAKRGDYREYFRRPGIGHGYNSRPVITELLKTNPETGRREVLEALRDAEGVLVRAAHLLNINRRTLQRILWREKLWEQLDAIREEYDRWKRSSSVWRSPTTG